MPTTPAPARVCRFVPAWALLVLVATLVSVAVNAGPGMAALVDYATHGHTAAVAAPSGPLVAPVSPEEDGPGWDCSTMGNRQCGADVDGGPVTADYAPGRVPAFTYCPPGGVLVENGAGVLVCSYGADR